MKRKIIGEKGSIVCSAGFFCLFIVSLLVNACSFHDPQFSYFNMLDEEKRTSDNKQAAEKFWSSVRPVSTLSDSLYRLGLHYQKIGEYDKAIQEFTKALRNDGTFCKAYNGIAMSYDAERQCESARNSYEEALQCAPDQAYIYNNYACSSLLCGDYSKGVALLEKANTLAGENTRIKNNLRIAQTIVMQERLTGYVPAQQLTTEVADSGLPGSGAESVKELAESSVPNAADRLEIVAEKRETLVLAPSVAPAHSQAAVLVEVSNGNGAGRMATRSAEFLRGYGFKVRSITNAKHFSFQESTIFYKEGFLPTAQELAAIIPGAQHLEKVDTMAKAFIGVRILLGRDLVALRFPEKFKGIAGFSDGDTEQPLVSTVSSGNDSMHN